LQVSSRVVAAFTAVWLVVCGVLAARHEATVTHVRDGAGGYVHGKALAGHHQGHDSDIHGQRHSDADAGECALLTAFHQAASADVTAPAVVTTARATHVQDLVSAAAPVVAAAVYRLAPKTSPPVVA
jgi:hypothetical protein